MKLILKTQRGFGLTRPKHTYILGTLGQSRENANGSGQNNQSSLKKSVRRCVATGMSFGKSKSKVKDPERHDYMNWQSTGQVIKEKRTGNRN